MKIGIIGSTGIKIDLLVKKNEFLSINIEGKECKYYHGTVGRHEIFLLARNNFGRPVPPHIVDYPRIMKQLKVLGVDFVVATSMVGSLNYDYKVGDYVVLDQFIDMTKTVMHTVFDDKAFAFVDFTNPYCEKVRTALINSCKQINLNYHITGCYVGVDGPRYETAAEVRAYRILGGDVVGMTNVPEAIMARELGMCYGSIAIVTNYAAGMKTEEILRKDCYTKTMEVLDQTVDVIKDILETVEDYADCICRTKNADMLYNSL